MLEQVSTKALKEELERRGREEQIRAKFTAHSPTTDFEKQIVKIAEVDLKDLLDGREIDPQWAHIAVMTSVYGADVFEKINEVLK